MIRFRLFNIRIVIVVGKSDYRIVLKKKKNNNAITNLYSKIKRERCYMCERCKTIHDAKNLQIHHIRPQCYYPNEITNPDNIIVLCSSCHQYIHALGANID